MTRWAGLREPHRRILGHVVGDWRSPAGSLRTASVGSSRAYIPQVFFSAVRFVGSIPSLGSLFFRLGPRTLFFVPLFALAPLRPVLGGFVCTRTTCMISGASTGGGFHHPPRCAPWVLPVTHSDRTLVLLKILLNLSQTSGTQVYSRVTWVSAQALAFMRRATRETGGAGGGQRTTHIGRHFRR